MSEHLDSLSGHWICKECGSDAASSATIRPLSRMDLDERDTLEVYGLDDDQFKHGNEIELCDCGSSHWAEPASNPAARRISA